MTALISHKVSLDTRAARKELEKLNDKITASAREQKAALDKLGSGIKTASIIAGGVAVVSVLAGVGTALAAAAKEAATYEQSIIEIQTISDELTFSTELVTKVSRELSDQYGTLAGQNVAGLYQTISAGATTAESATALLGAATQLSVAGLAELPTTVDALSVTLNSYRDSNLQAAEAADILFSVVKFGKTKLSELAPSIGQVTKLAAELNVSFRETGAALALMTQTTGTTALAVTQLKSIFVAVTQETAKSKSAAKALGIEFSAAALQAKGLQRFLQDIADSKPTTAQLQQLFGRSEALLGVLSLLSGQGQAFAGQLDNMAKSSGAAKRAADKLNASLAGQIKRFDAVTEQAGLAFFTVATGSKDAAEGLTKLNDAIVRLTDSGAVARLADVVLASIEAGIDSLGRAITVLLPALVNLRSTLTGLSSLGEFLSGPAEFFEVKVKVVPELVGPLVGGPEPFVGPPQADLQPPTAGPTDEENKAAAKAAKTRAAEAAKAVKFARETARIEREGARAEARIEDDRDQRTREVRAESALALGLAGIKRDSAARVKAIKAASAAEREALKASAANDQFAAGIGAGIAQLSLRTAEFAGAGASAAQSAAVFFGGMVSQLGSVVFNLGLAAATGGAIGTVVPFLAGITGGAAGIAVGVAAMAGGLALIGAGSALSGGGSPTSGSVPSVSGGGSVSGGFDVDIPSVAFAGSSGATGTAANDAPTTVVNIFGVGNTARAARETEDVVGRSRRRRLGG